MKEEKKRERGGKRREERRNGGKGSEPKTRGKVEEEKRWEESRGKRGYEEAMEAMEEKRKDKSYG